MGRGARGVHDQADVFRIDARQHEGAIGRAREEPLLIAPGRFAAGVEIEHGTQQRRFAELQGLAVAPGRERRIEIAEHRSVVRVLALLGRREQHADVGVRDHVAQVLALVARVQMYGAGAEQRAAIEKQQIVQAIRHQDADVVPGLDAERVQCRRMTLRLAQDVAIGQALRAHHDRLAIAMHRRRLLQRPDDRPLHG